MRIDNAVVEVNQYDPLGVEFGLAENPYGMQPYKHQGKERINLLGMNVHNHGARLADNVLGRWLSMDPLAEKYYSISLYAYCLGNSVKYIDKDGKKVEFAAGVSEQFKKDFGEAVKHLNKYGAGGMLSELHKSSTMYYIDEATKSSEFNATTKTIFWFPRKGLLTDELHVLSATTILNHEIDHALQFDKNPKQQRKDKTALDDNYRNAEEKRVITGSEQTTAKRLGEIKVGEVTRKNHRGTTYSTLGPTSIEIIMPIIKPTNTKENETNIKTN
jgi:RHS repeat-associated protein